MNLTIGFSLDLTHFADPGTGPVLEQMLESGCQVIQMHAHSDLLNIRPSHLDLVKKFNYRTIHLPELRNAELDKQLIAAALELAEDIQANNFTIHPTGSSSFEWLDEFFGSKLCIENMDWLKTFGNTVDELKQVFAELPNAGWTFDVNHIKTNDPSMDLAKSFYAELGSRLRNYHLSGFVDKNLAHTLLADTKQDDIIAKVEDLSKPIIIESLGAQNIDRFKEELNYIVPRLRGESAR